MTKNEVIGLLNIQLMNSVRQRDMTNPDLYPEEYGYYNGQFRAFETVIGMLATVDVHTYSAVDERSLR